MGKEPKKMYEEVAERIIEQLKKGTAPWQKPWDSSGAEFLMPYNAVTNKPYKGLNSLYLHLFSPFSDPRWSTFKQSQNQGWQVKKGAKGMRINFVKTHELLPKKDEKGKPILDEAGKALKVKVKLDNPLVSKAWVFNAEQIQGIPEIPKVEPANLWEKVNRAEKIVRESGAIIDHVPGDKAFYSPMLDRIQMPDRKQFDAADKYYATLLHELGHWTGHENRLNRDLANKFGTPEYAREELRAEIASMMIGSELKLGHDPKQHVAYVDSWIKILKDNPFEIHAASADAQRIYDFIIDFEKRNLKRENAMNVHEGFSQQRERTFEEESEVKIGR